MARTSQTGGSWTSKVAYSQYFDDHAGNSALRIGTCVVEPGTSPSPPSDHSSKPVFCFQVYTSIELNLDDERPATKRQRTADSGSGSAFISPTNIARLKSFLAPQIQDAECPDPIWEVYTLLGADAFAFADHARKEIGHRKELRRQGLTHVPLIPHLVLSDDDSRKTAFLIGIDAASGWQSSAQQTPGRPLWVHYDPRVPATVETTEHALRLEDAPGTMGLSEDEIRVWPEQIDMLVKRIRDPDELAFKLPTMLSLSCVSEEYRAEDVNLGMDFGPPAIDQTTTESDSKLLEALRETALKLRTADLTIERNGETVIASNADSAETSDLRYAIYVPFLAAAEDALVMLEHTARVFTDLMWTKLASITGAQQKTVHFEFSIPPEPNDTSVVAAYREAGHPPNYSGALVAQGAETDTTRRRLHPLSINPHFTLNDPDTCGFDPYKIFAVVIDRADFIHDSACVRFLLADGGKVLDDECLSYLEGQAWRSAGMREVARRLALMEFEDAA